MSLPGFCRLFVVRSFNHRSTHGSTYKDRFGVGSSVGTKTGECACCNREIPDAHWSCGHSGLVRFICGASHCFCSELKTEPDSVCRCDVVLRSRLGHGQRGQEQPAIGGNSAIDYSERLAWRRKGLTIGPRDRAGRDCRSTWLGEEREQDVWH